jgi:argininosuccinate synthase
MKIQNFRDIEKLFTKEDLKVLCLYSGGLDGSFMISYLTNELNCNVTALIIGLGDIQDRKELEIRANKLGANILFSEQTNEFIKDFVIPAIQSQSFYLGEFPISASLSRPLIAKIAFDVANEKNFDVILHSANRSQNSLRRINGALTSLGCKQHYGSPFELEPITRSSKKKFLAETGFVELQDRMFSEDKNIWCREFEGGIVEDPENVDISESCYLWSSSNYRDDFADIHLTFRNGIPIAFNGRTDLAQIISELNGIAGSFGLGRYVGFEEIENGKKVLEIREMPAAFILLNAYQRIESALINANTIRENKHLEQLWVQEACEGRWYGPLRDASQAFITSIAQRINVPLDIVSVIKHFNLEV